MRRTRRQYRVCSAHAQTDAACMRFRNQKLITRPTSATHVTSNENQRHELLPPVPDRVCAQSQAPAQKPQAGRKSDSGATTLFGLGNLLCCRIRIVRCHFLLCKLQLSDRSQLTFTSQQRHESHQFSQIHVISVEDDRNHPPARNCCRRGTL